MTELQEGLLWDYTVFHYPKSIPTLLPKSMLSGPITILEKTTVMLVLLQLYVPKNWILYSFIFWRIAYMLFGYCLKLQSTKKSIVGWMIMLNMGQKLPTPPSSYVLYWRKQISLYMERDTLVEYDYCAMPVEFNTWILCRQFANLIIANGVFSYLLFAFYNYQPNQEHPWRNITHLIGGSAILLFNLWIRLDIVKSLDDFSCYWGDFFFLVENKKSFDGVLESIPHPMYSVGYIGYYGITLLTQSYTVFFVSISSHFLDILFLRWVEFPHTAKLYDPPKPFQDSHYLKELHTFFSRDMVLLYNLDPTRSGDILTLFIIIYTIITALFIGPCDTLWKFYFYVGQVLFWRILHTHVGGLVLYLQAKDMFWTKLYVRKGLGLKEAFDNWKVYFNLTHTMTFVSFFVAAVRFYVIPPSYSYEILLLRHVLGLFFIVFHIWIAVSIYQILGPFGWFRGDFFIESLRSRNVPTYSGLYRYLDHPILYTISCWGVTLICSSWILFFLTLFGQASHLFVTRFVEKPYFDKIYGEESEIHFKAQNAKIHSDTPITSPPPDFDMDQDGIPLISRRISVRDTLRSVVKELEYIAKPHVTAFVQQTKRQVVKFANSVALEDTLPREDLPLFLYSLKLVKERENEQVSFQLGEPIILEFTACRETMKRKDWIGIYSVHQNFDENLTTSRCDWKWSYLAGKSKVIAPTLGSENPWKKCEDGYYFGETPVTLRQSNQDPGLRLVTGRLVFEKEQLPWQIGSFEARYHYDGKYIVLANSIKFDIKLDIQPIPKPMRTSMTEYHLIAELSPLISSCLEMPAIDPYQNMLDCVQVPKVLEDQVDLVGYKKVVSNRIVYVINHLYNIDISYQAIESIQSLHGLVSHILEALKIGLGHHGI